MTAAERKYSILCALAARVAGAIAYAEQEAEFYLAIGYDHRAIQLTLEIEVMEQLLNQIFLSAHTAYAEIIIERVNKGEIKIYASY